MSTRRYVVDHVWAKLRDRIKKTDYKAGRALSRLRRAFNDFDKLVRLVAYLERRRRKREAELDAGGEQRKEVPS